MPKIIRKIILIFLRYPDLLLILVGTLFILILLAINHNH